MKKTMIAIAMMTLILTGSVLAQHAKSSGSISNRRQTNLGDTATHEIGHNRRQVNGIGNPFGMGGTVTAGVKNRQGYNLGDTATHEIGYKETRRQNQISFPKMDGNNKESGIVSKQINRTRSLNLLPYMEQSNIYRCKPR